MENNKPTKSRYYTAVLYPDNKEQAYFMEHHDEYGLSFAYILHDKDPEIVSGEKKPHWHLFIKLDYACGIKTACNNLCDALCCAPQAIEPIYNPIGYSRYLTHSDKESIEAGKWKYDESEIRGDLTLIRKHADEGTIADLWDALTDWVHEYSVPNTYSQALLYLESKGLIKTLMRFGYNGTQLIKDAMIYKRDWSEHAPETRSEIEEKINELLL